MATLDFQRLDGSNIALDPAVITAMTALSAAQLARAGVTEGVLVTRADGTTEQVRGTPASVSAAMWSSWVSGATTGGQPSKGRRAFFGTPYGSLVYTAMGTDAASVAGTIYRTDVDVDLPMTVTGIAMQNGTVVGTDNVIYALLDEAGVVLGTTALAGTLSAVADVPQQIALTTPLRIAAGRYQVALQVSGATAAHQRVPTAGFVTDAGSAAGVFGTIPTQGVLTAFAAGTGPIGYLYT